MIERWSIHEKSGHCAHPTGLHAYIGSAETVDYVPLLGPFSTNGRSLVEIAHPAWSLTKVVEEKFPDRFAIWGALDTTHRQVPVTVLGQDRFWIPDPSARSNWALMAARSEPIQLVRDFLNREWEIQSDTHLISHRTGLDFSFSRDCFTSSWASMFRGSFAEPRLTNLTHNIWRQINWHDGVHSLANVGFRVLSAYHGRQSIARIIRLKELPALDYSLVV